MFVDVETTGVERYARIVSIGLVMLDPSFRTVRTVYLVFDPRKDSHPEAAAIHGWDDWETRFQDLFVDHAETIHAFLAEADLVVAHNAEFDLHYIERELDKVGLSWPVRRSACTMQMARDRWPGGSAKLDACLRRIGLSRASQRHGALEDAALTMSLFLNLVGMDKPLTVDVSAIRPANYRPPPPRPEGPLPRRTPKKRRKIAVAPPPTGGDQSPDPNGE
ncbi:MAG: exonuclease domain-containing protein [Alphaproteobacteria bacterium]